MTDVKAIVLRAAGINCDLETEYALELAGAAAQRIHINRLIEDKRLLDQFQILVFPGGFSYGDDVAAGKILANQIVHHLYTPVQKFIDDGIKEIIVHPQTYDHMKYLKKVGFEKNEENLFVKKLEL